MKRRIVLFLIFTIICESWSIPKPMESITNYNVMMVHGAYGIKNSDGELQGFEPDNYSQAIDAKNRLGAATMGSYMTHVTASIDVEGYFTFDNMELFGLRDGTNSVRITPSAKPNVVLNPESFVLYSNR